MTLFLLVIVLSSDNHYGPGRPEAAARALPFALVIDVFIVLAVAKALFFS